MYASASRQLNLFVSRSKYHVCPFVTLEKVFETSIVQLLQKLTIFWILAYSLAMSLKAVCMYVVLAARKTIEFSKI